MMKTDDEMIIKHLLQDDECRVDNFAPIEYFSITSGIFEFMKSVESAEDNFCLGAIETEVISFCILNADNISLKNYVNKLKDLLLTDFSIEKKRQCQTVFDNVRDMYVEKYSKPIILLEIR